MTIQTTNRILTKELKAFDVMYKIKMPLLFTSYDTKIHKYSREIQTVTVVNKIYYLRACNPSMIRPKINTKVKAFQSVMFLGS